MHDGNIILIKEGQLITGRKQLSEVTGIPETTVERILKMLENEHQIGQQKTTKYRLITILNWADHQTRTEERTTNGQQTDTYKNDKKEKNTVVAEPPTVDIPIGFEERPTKVPKAKYPHSKEVFGWFPNPQKSWEYNTTELQHSELLFLRGEKAVKQALAFVRNHEDDENFNYKVIKPSDLERKWEDLKLYAKRNG